MSETATSVGVEMPTKHTDQDVAARLQELYHKDDIARAVFDDAAERTYVVAKTSVERIARIAHTTRAKAGDLCILLAVIGVATFEQAHTTGDDKFPTRIHWHYVPRSIGLVAKGAEETLQNIHWDKAMTEQSGAITSNGASRSVAGGFIDHSYPLCDGRIATLHLPTDLTRGEADRLSRFIVALAQPD
jgi:3-keto-L-gulonate-6-phosphate decarboxylase